MLVFVADIIDDCILGCDFLNKTGISNSINHIFSNSFNKNSKPIDNDSSTKKCCRILQDHKELPEFLEDVFINSSRNLDSSQQEKFSKLLIEFQDIFQDNDVAGKCNLVDHKIKLSDNLPIKQPVRPLPFHLRSEINKMIDEMHKQGVIEESTSSWCSPVVLKRKKDGTFRFCVDFRKLNDKTIKDSYPLPRIDQTLDRLSGNSWFSTLDLKSGYWQVKIRDQDREKTAFSIGNGLWQFIVMAFGLCNAPATFERLMEKLLRDLLNDICLIYLDDVMVMSKTFDEMLKNLQTVFSRIRDANLKLNRKKCVFFQREVEYLGHIVSEKGKKTDPRKIETMITWPVPTTKKQVKSFTSLCSYYRRFIKGFSSIVKPLYHLTEKKVKFEWSEDCQKSFSHLKEVLSTPPILAFPREDTPFILDTDASDHGIGAVLSQVHDDEEKVIAYYSRVLSKAERNYCVTRRELLAVVESVKNFHHYLCGKLFSIRTDHSALTWLLSFKDLDGQLARWVSKLDQYDLKIIHRKGTSHSNADGLSRRPCDNSSCRYCCNIETKYSRNSSVGRIIFEDTPTSIWRDRQQQDKVIMTIFDSKKNNKKLTWAEISSEDEQLKIYLSQWDSLVISDGLLYREWISSDLKTKVFQLIIPQAYVQSILEEAHDSPSGGHFGINKTLEKIRKRFYWASCKKDVENWCKTCSICVARKGPTGKGHSSMKIYNVGLPFERVQMDILGPFPVSSLGNRYLLVIIDCFTKWVEAFPLPNMRTKTIADIFVREIVSRYGIPLEVHTDQGRNFDAKLVKELAQFLGIRKTRSTPLHPQSNGQVERQNRTILDYLSKYISDNQKDWDRWIALYLLAYRSSSHATTGASPAEMYTGRDLRLPLDLLRGCPPSENTEDNYGDYVQRLKSNLDKVHQAARKNISLNAKRRKMIYDRTSRHVDFKEQQKVWFYNPRRVKGKSPKLQSDWEGPYVIVKRINDVVFCIQKSSRHKKKIVHIDRLAIYYDR